MKEKATSACVIDTGNITEVMNVLMKREGMTYRKLAGIMGTSVQYVWKTLNGDRDVTFGTVRRMLAALGYGIQIEDAGKDIDLETIPGIDRTAYVTVSGVSKLAGYEIVITKKEEQK